MRFQCGYRHAGFGRTLPDTTQVTCTANHCLGPADPLFAKHTLVGSSQQWPYFTFTVFSLFTMSLLFKLALISQHPKTSESQAQEGRPERAREVQFPIAMRS